MVRIKKVGDDVSDKEQTKVITQQNKDISNPSVFNVFGPSYILHKIKGSFCPNLDTLFMII